MATVAKLNVQIGAELKGLEGALKKAESGLQKFSKNATAIGGLMSKALTAPLVGFATASVFAFDKQSKAIAQVEQGIISTGGAANRTSKQLQQMASALQENSLFGDEEILTKVTAQLLTFTNISGKAFDRTQQAALDLASRLGGDLQSASIQLGKALNDPIANLSALSRSGIQFSKDQKDLIDTLVETGRLAEAQVIILDELEKQYGGSAKAAAEAGSGGVTQLKNSFGDLMEQIGEVIVEAINPFVDRLKEIVKQLQTTDKETLKFYATIGLIGAAIGPALVALGLMAKGLLAVKTALMFTFKNPYVLVAAGVIALTGYFAKLYIEAKRVNDLLKEPIDAKLPLDDQIQKTIERVQALDTRVSEMRKNLGVGVTTEAGLEAQQRQLRVAEYRLSVERQVLVDLVAQKNRLDENVNSATTLNDTTVKTVDQYSSLTSLIEKIQARIDEITNTQGELNDEQRKELAIRLQTVDALQQEIDRRKEIARLQANQQKAGGVQRVTELPDTGKLTQTTVNTERYASSVAILGSKLQQVTVNTQALGQATEQTSGATELLNQIGQTFVDSFGAGMANLIVQGGKLKDILSNIGRLLASAAIQKGISILLTGGLTDGKGFFGSGGGFFGAIGKLFGGKQAVNDALITSTGRVIEFSPKDNILAMQDFGNIKQSNNGVASVRVSVDTIRLSGSDILIALKNAERAYG